MTLIGYARCSTDKQDLAVQKAALEALGVAADRIYTDHGLTGTNQLRPGLDQAFAAVRTGDTLVVPNSNARRYNVETTPATTPDDNMVEVVHQSLERRGLLPGEHLVDKGYTGSHVLVDSQQRHGVTIVGPVADDPSWQAHLDDGLTKAAFAVDWERKVVTCPAGKRSISWLPNTWPKNGMVFEARFATRDCFPCPLRPRCTRGKREPRIIGLQAREHFEALQGARRHQKTEAFRANYAARAGIEGTHAQAINRCGLRRCRYIGLAKTRLQHVLTAAAINLVRVADWCAGTPAAKTRRSRFAVLRMAA